MIWHDNESATPQSILDPYPPIGGGLVYCIGAVAPRILKPDLAVQPSELYYIWKALSSTLRNRKVKQNMADHGRMEAAWVPNQTSNTNVSTLP